MYTITQVNWEFFLVLLDILVKSRWILAFDMAFERSQYPPLSTFNTYLSGMRPLVCAIFQSEVPQDEKSENGNCAKKNFLDISAKSRWILAYDTDFQRSQYPPK